MQAYTRAKLKSERTPVLLRALFTTAVGTIERMRVPAGLKPRFTAPI
ncbi:MAG TPA: hypothetical protein VGI44_17895 [Acidimicrobiales bacterium]